MKNISHTSAQERPARTRGFTLIELLVVIAIIALLTGIVMTNLTGAKGRARDAKRVSDLGNIQFALELYFDRCKQYPTPAWGQKVDLAAVNGCPQGSGITLGSFLTSVPQPSTGAGQTDYYYNTLVKNSLPIGYALKAILENSNEVIKDALPSSFETILPTGVTWSSSTNPDCNNDPTAKKYCLGSK